MAYDSPGSPRFQQLPMRKPYRTENASTSPQVSPTNTTASRFQAALESMPSRHAYHSSISSGTSDEGLSRGINPHDSYMPNGNRMFDALQRELSLKDGLADLASSTRSDDQGAPPPSRFGDDSDRYDTLRSAPRPRRRAGPEEVTSSSFYNGSSHDDLPDLANGQRTTSSDDHDFSASSRSSPAIPLVPSSDSLSESMNGNDTVRTRERRAGERVFPAPLYLRSDRSFSPGSSIGASSSSVAPTLPSTAPLSFQRRPSGSYNLADQNQPAIPNPRDRNWRDAPSNLSSSTRSTVPYQSHRPQQSSTSSTSHVSSLPYSSSPSYEPRAQALSSSLTISTSPSSFTRGAVGSLTPPSSTLPTPQSALPPSGPAAFASAQPLSSDAPISAQALLLHVHSLRSSASPMTQTQSQGMPAKLAGLMQADSLVHQRGRSAEASAVNDVPEEASALGNKPSALAGRGLSASSSSTALARLDTVDLSHKRIAEVPVEVINELKDEVEKLALGYNLLRDLPPHFAQLGNRLKYLNIRVNQLTVFPSVLCEMPSLEILDISRNKLRRLPPIPGTLARLKVFSIAKNRIRRLPVWFTAMTQLKVLKLDHNPLEWPPREVSTFPGAPDGQALTKQEEADEMQRWLPMLMRWMRDNKDRELERERDREMERRRVQPFEYTQVPPGEAAVRTAAAELPETSGSELQSGDGREATRAGVDEDPATTTLEETLAVSALLDGDAAARHSRGSSLSTAETATSTTRPGLKSKKSLPDLRQSHATILAERRTGTSLEDGPAEPELPARFQPLRPLEEEEPAVEAVPPPVTGHIDAESSASDTTTSRPAGPHGLVRSYSEQPASRSDVGSAPMPPIVRKGTAPLPDEGKADVPPRDHSGPFDAMAPAENERNSGAYFRRQSMLPASSIAKTLPPTLLRHIETVRGILFSLSQVHAALRQFVVYAAQERLAGPVTRLMSTSDASTAALIDALDRFDSLSHRGTPPASIVEEVFATCRQSVDLLRSLVDALQAPLRGLTAAADLRYTRTLLLMLFGAIGEIAQAWAQLNPTPAMRGTEPAAVATVLLQPPTPSASEGMAMRLPEGGVRLTRQRSVTRRHAGSFSVEDVEMGANLPPAIVPPLPPMPGGPLMLDEQAAARETGNYDGTVRARPAFSARRPSRTTTPPPPIAVPPPLAYEAMVQRAFEQPMTPGGIGMFERSASARQASVSGPDVPPVPVLPANSASGTVESSLPALMPASYHPHRISRPVSTLNADETFIDVADSTISIASDVYGMLLDSFEDPNLSTQYADIGKRRLRELVDLCKAGNETTARLEKSVERVRGDDGRGRLKFTLADARKLGDASFDFVQNVIRSAKLIKAISQDFAFPLQMREAVGQLTLGTREFARLLSHAQTSFRPTQAVDRGTGATGQASMGGSSGGGAVRPPEGLAAREGYP